MSEYKWWSKKENNMRVGIMVFVAVLSLGVLVLMNPVQADEKGSAKGSMMEEKGSHKGSMMDGAMTAEGTTRAPMQVGNAICPISGELISGVGEGNGVQIEHEGKIYNVCCKFCAKDFKKDPEKFSKVIEQNLADGTDPGREYESDHDDDAEHHEDSHEDHDH